MTEPATQRRRLWLKQVAVAAALLPGGVSSLIREALANGQVPVGSGMQRIRGDVRINGQPAQIGQLIAPDDTISTGAGSEAIYVMGQDAFLQRDNSSVSFGADATQKLMRVLTGKILSVFGKGPRTITVSTATIGIRGTACYIEDEPGLANKSRTYLCLCYGEVEVVPSAAPNEQTRYSTRHHDHPIYIHDDMAMPTMMVAAPVVNHSDAELSLLEALVGRRPPFAGSPSRY